MMEILRDSAWQFVGIVLALLSIVATFAVYLWQRQTKELAFGVVSSRRPIAIADELSSRVTVHVDGKPVENLRLMVFGLKNSGHRAIAVADFERPLSVAFGGGQIVSAEIASQHPKNLGAELSFSNSNVVLSPMLLNPGDQLLIQVLLSAAKPEWSLDARIVDVPSIAPINAAPRLPPFFQSAMPESIAFVLALAVGAFLLEKEKKGSVMLFGLAAFMLIISGVHRWVHGLGKSARRMLDA
ncbi:hypothetical protein [Variovorax sp. Sphag1AA]|uniref:hypothetical protein n=1 Tax=Variovorax sp. Sphag1AA TaxID=2587027 RepID=UPI00161E9754|nr:hypothetical protein [Variovorax sp. Sphag1AA]MBB3180088.1 hypothetical protein [Variovorax sp. Sphag1AA]